MQGVGSGTLVSLHWKRLLAAGKWKSASYEYGPAYERPGERIEWDWMRVGWVHYNEDQTPTFYKRLTTALRSAG